MAEQDNSLREDLEAAIETVEETAEEETSAVEVEAAEETTGEAAEAKAEVSGEGGEVAGEPGTVPAPEAAAPTPPVDWAPEVQDKWNDLPAEVQAAIADRERHFNDVMQQSSDARGAVEQFSNMFQPYIPLMQAEGVSDPLVAVEGLLKTTAMLAIGSPQQKAQRIAGLINHYGVDIATLDALLAGEPVADPQETKIQQMLDQRLAPVNQLLNRVQQAEQQSQAQFQQETQQTIEQFAKDPQNVFFPQVREVMADFLDMAAQRGLEMTLKQAYDRACMSVPEISQKILSGQAGGIASGSQQQIAGKRNAASSVHGHPGAVGTSDITEDMSLRETLEVAAGLHGKGRI